MTLVVVHLLSILGSSRTGSGNTTQYTLDRVRATDLAEEWELDADNIDNFVGTAVSYDASAIYISPREDLLARSSSNRFLTTRFVGSRVSSLSRLPTI